MPMSFITLAAVMWPLVALSTKWNAGLSAPCSPEGLPLSASCSSPQLSAMGYVVATRACMQLAELECPKRRP